MKARLKRMSLRRKLALGYAIAMALVLATTAIIVEVSFEDELAYNIDASLRAQADAVSTLVGRIATTCRCRSCAVSSYTRRRSPRCSGPTARS